MSTGRTTDDDNLDELEHHLRKTLAVFDVRHAAQAFDAAPDGMDETIIADLDAKLRLFAEVVCERLGIRTESRKINPKPAVRRA